MTTDIVQSFGFESNNVRTAHQDDGSIWFCLGDILNAIGTKTDTNDAKIALEDGLGDGTVINLPTTDALQRERETLFASEAGVMFLLSRSRTDAGKRLNRFIFNEVLPSIRKTGSYSIAQEPISEPQRQLAPQRDLIEWIEALKSIGLDKDPILLALIAQRAAESLGGNTLSSTQQVILTVQAHNLGYSAKQIGSGFDLGKFLKKQGLTPNGKTKHGKYDVNVYDLTPDLDRAIHAYFS